MVHKSTCNTYVSLYASTIFIVVVGHHCLYGGAGHRTIVLSAFLPCQAFRVRPLCLPVLTSHAHSLSCYFSLHPQVPTIHRTARHTSNLIPRLLAHGCDEKNACYYWQAVQCTCYSGEDGTDWQAGVGHVSSCLHSGEKVLICMRHSKLVG